MTTPSGGGDKPCTATATAAGAADETATVSTAKDKAVVEDDVEMIDAQRMEEQKEQDVEGEVASTAKTTVTTTTVLIYDDDDSGDDDDDSTDPFAAFNTAGGKTSKDGENRSTATNIKERKVGKKFLQINIKSSSVGGDSSGPSGGYKQPLTYDERMSTTTATSILLNDSNDMNMANIVSDLDFDAAIEEQELEDSLRFFEEPHEDQDPEFQRFERDQKRKRILSELQKLDEEEKAGRDEVERIVNEQLKERQAGTERSVERYRQSKVIDEQKKEMDKLNQHFKEKMSHSQRKIHEGMQVLRKRHEDETRRYMQQHRQKIHQQNLPEQIANAEWADIAAKLRAKSQNHMAEFARKGDELKSKTEADYKREALKIKKKYELREKDVEHNRQTINSRLVAGFQQMRSRYLKRYSDSISKRREVLQRDLVSCHDVKAEERPKEDEKDNRKEVNEKDTTNPALRPPSPLKSCGLYFQESNHELSGAAIRHKHRKGVLSQIPKQLSVEIHNEGVWINKLSEKKGDDKKNDVESDRRHFIPWGYKARELLHSIVCGEIPFFFESDNKFQLGDTVAANGGHIRCVMTDLRTSDETASANRAVSVYEQHATALRKLQDEKNVLTQNIENALKDVDVLNSQRVELETKMTANSSDLDKGRSQLMAIRQKYAKYFDVDGSIIKGPNGEKFKASYDKYEATVDAYQKRGQQIQSKIGEAKLALQKKNASIKQAQRNLATLTNTIKKREQVLQQVKSGSLRLHQIEGMDSFSARVKWHTAALDATAGKRRAELLHKRNSNSSKTWDQTFPGLSSMLKRSLYFKMHRRRQQIVLRPSFTSTVTDLRQIIERKHAESSKKGNVSTEAVDADVQAAEQRYLLATHTLAPRGGKVPSVPNSNGWAEPGCHLVLDVPSQTDEDRILPVSKVPPLVQTNLSELYSAPGRQASAMLKTAHLRSLEAPLSAIGVATSLSETNPAIGLSSDVTFSPNDPFQSSNEVTRLGYIFTHKVIASPTPATAQRKRSITSKTSSTPSPAKSKSSKKKPSATTELERSPPKLGNAPSKSPTAPKSTEKKRKSATQSEGIVPRPAPKRRKSDSAKAQKQQQPKHTQPKHLQQQKQQPLPQRSIQQSQAHKPQQTLTQPAPMPSINDPNMHPRPIMMQHPQASSGGQFNRGQPMQQPQQQQNAYGHFMKAMPSPVTTQNAGNRGSFQFPSNPQMQQQFRMMQQQQQQRHQQQQAQQPQMGYVQTPQGMQQMPQFFSQMAQQQFAQQQSLMPGLASMGQQQQMHPEQQQQHQQNKPSSDDSNDPLFMLKDI